MSDGIADERREANRIKSEQPILAIIGNPPYRRLLEGENHTLVGDWMDRIWDDLKEPVRNAGQGNQLNTFPELSVAFWRWAIWKLFESENAPGRGVVAFISNRKYLTGWPYAGLRKMMRERFDRIEIIDMRGDVRRGERADVDADQGVFNIQSVRRLRLLSPMAPRHRGKPRTFFTKIVGRKVFLHAEPNSIGYCAALIQEHNQTQSPWRVAYSMICGPCRFKTENGLI